MNPKINTQEKIARICWNTNDWEFPSGREGKSKNNSYESKNGYGHEEWLLNRTHIFSNGYHYGYLEPLQRCPFDGKKNIHLYTYTPNKQKQYIGCIKNAECVGAEESEKIWKEYIRKGWEKSMRQDLKKIGINTPSNWSIGFNVKFKFENLNDESDRSLFLEKEEPNIRSSYYTTLLNKREPFRFVNTPNSTHDDLPDRISDPNNDIPEGAKLRITVNRYERSNSARTKCIDRHGYTCIVCGMDFSKVYGEIGKDFIHVHHIVPISKIGKAYRINPTKDLVPICPNCHAMLHKGNVSVEELKKIVKRNKYLIYNKTLIDMDDKIKQINNVLNKFFSNPSNPRSVRAKDLMDLFIAHGIFIADHRNGLPIRKLLRKLDRENNLHLIPFVRPERKNKNTNWYFEAINPDKTL